MPVEFDEYKGHKLMNIKKDANDPFGFKIGKVKARLIVANIDEIKKFAEEAGD